MPTRGLWKSRGYGWLLEIGADGYALFDYTDISCVEFERGTCAQFERGFDRLEITGDALSLYVKGDITRYRFDRVAAFPAVVIRLDDRRNTDPVFNFEVLWRAFQQDYAFFARHRVDWQAIYRRHRPRVDAGTSAAELRGVFEEMLGAIPDNHVYLHTERSRFISDRIADIKSWMVDAFDLESASLGEATTIARYQAFVRNEILRGKARVAGNDLLSWGFVDPGIGYLAVLRLFGFADTADAKAAVGLPKPRPDVAEFLARDLTALGRMLDDAMRDLAGADALILDVRVNGGGFDKAGMMIADRFADRRRLAFSKRAREGDGLGPVQEQFIEPTEAGSFTKPVYLLTAQRTASAGEVLALCLSALPHVTRVGQPTLGIFSDDLAKHLPNGWVTSISNEVYAGPDGTVYEGSGVPPQVTVPVFRQYDLRGALKLAVEKAMDLANPVRRRNS